MIVQKLWNMGEYAAAGLFEKPQGSLFLRKAIGLRRYYEHCAVPPYNGKPLYPSGKVDVTSSVLDGYPSAQYWPSR